MGLVVDQLGDQVVPLSDLLAVLLVNVVFGGELLVERFVYI